jgi:hypothetical protein
MIAEVINYFHSFVNERTFFSERILLKLLWFHTCFQLKGASFVFRSLVIVIATAVAVSESYVI